MWQECGATGTLSLLMIVQNGTATLEAGLAVLTKLNIDLPYDQVITVLG